MSGITLEEAAGKLPTRRGKKVHINTLKRWIHRGCRGVKLAAFKLGNVWYTTEGALEAFQGECTGRTYSGMVLKRSEGERRAAVKQAQRTLKQNGFHSAHSKTKG